MKGYIGPREVLVDDVPIPPITTISVLVPDATGNRELCTATMVNRDQRLVRLKTAPRDSHYAVGDYIQYGWMPDCDFPILKFGRGHF